MLIKKKKKGTDTCINLLKKKNKNKNVAFWVYYAMASYSIIINTNFPTKNIIIINNIYVYICYIYMLLIKQKKMDPSIATKIYKYK